jgi:hypothetical protein
MTKAQHPPPSQSLFADQHRGEVDINCQNKLTNCASVLFYYHLDNLVSLRVLGVNDHRQELAESYSICIGRKTTAVAPVRVGLVHRLAGKAHMCHPRGGVPGIICGNQTAASHVLPKRRVGRAGSGGTPGETSSGA